ncbi:MAG: hypothetical protein DSY60_05040 [Persephonella sp.]|nr:MAG: hypothetical protein DSY60_05040 [Persephonella sp.]
MKTLEIFVLSLFFISFLYAQEFIFSVDGKVIPSNLISKNSIGDINLKDELKDISEEEEEKLDNKLLKSNTFRILFVGDSMVEAIKGPSRNICNEKRFECDYLFKRGLRTDAWIHNGWYSVSLILKIADFKPNIIVISSGTNDIYNRETPNQIYKDFMNIVRLIDDVSKNIDISPKIVIVAPPIPNDKNLNRVLKERFSNMKNIFVIQSKNLHLKLWDGIHPNANSSKIWAKKIINFIEKVSKN